MTKCLDRDVVGEVDKELLVIHVVSIDFLNHISPTRSSINDMNNDMIKSELIFRSMNDFSVLVALGSKWCLDNQISDEVRLLLFRYGVPQYAYVDPVFIM